MLACEPLIHNMGQHQSKHCHLVYRARYESTLLVVGFAASHAVCLASSCLAISQYGAIAAIQSCLDDVISTRL